MKKRVRNLPVALAAAVGWLVNAVAAITAHSDEATHFHQLALLGWLIVFLLATDERPTRK